MPAMPTDPAAPQALTDADRVRDRMNRYAPLATKAIQPARERMPEAERHRRHGTGKREGFRLGWRGWLVVEVLAVAVIAGVVLVWPPASACREYEAKIGFYAGDTLGKCIRRGVVARIDAADQRIKMAVRGSGK